MKITLPDDVKQIIETLEQHGYEGYAVGGCVRDSILGRIPNDWDITTSAKPEQVKRIFRHRSKSRNCSYARSIPGSSTER